MTKLEELLDHIQVGLAQEMKLQLKGKSGEVPAAVMKEIREFLRQNGTQFGNNDQPKRDLEEALPFPAPEAAGQDDATIPFPPQAVNG